MLGKTCYLTSSHISLQASHLKTWWRLSYFYVPSHSVAPFSDAFLSSHPLFLLRHALTLPLAVWCDTRQGYMSPKAADGEGEEMSEVEERSDVTSQKCWQHVLCSALANTMPKKREIRPRSSKQLPKHPRHESWGKTAGGIQSAGPSIQSSSFHYAEMHFTNKLKYSAVWAHMEKQKTSW